MKKKARESGVCDYQIFCINNMINIAFKESLNQQDIFPLITQVRAVAEGFHKFVKQCKTLHTNCNELGIYYVKISKPAENSWNLTCCTICSLCKMTPALQRSQNF
jgi:hypothetical protein